MNDLWEASTSISDSDQLGANYQIPYIHFNFEPTNITNAALRQHPQVIFLQNRLDEIIKRANYLEKQNYRLIKKLYEQQQWSRKLGDNQYQWKYKLLDNQLQWENKLTENEYQWKMKLVEQDFQWKIKLSHNEVQWNRKLLESEYSWKIKFFQMQNELKQQNEMLITQQEAMEKRIAQIQSASKKDRELFHMQGQILSNSTKNQKEIQLQSEELKAQEYFLFREVKKYQLKSRLADCEKTFEPSCQGYTSRALLALMPSQKTRNRILSMIEKSNRQQ